MIRFAADRPARDRALTAWRARSGSPASDWPRASAKASTRTGRRWPKPTRRSPVVDLALHAALRASIRWCRSTSTSRSRSVPTSARWSRGSGSAPTPPAWRSATPASPAISTFSRHTHAVVAADGGERDVPTDTAILDGLKTARDARRHSSTSVSPTTSARRSSWRSFRTSLAGNISIVHKVTGSSRTFMGEEIAGVERRRGRLAAHRRRPGRHLPRRRRVPRRPQGHRCSNCALGGILWAGEHLPIWAAAREGRRRDLGSVGAFLVLEAREHAEARGRKPYAKLLDVHTDQSRRRPGDVAAKLTRQFDEIAPPGSAPVAVLSARPACAQATREERELLGRIDRGRPGRYGAGHGNACSAAATSATFRRWPASPPSRSRAGGFYRPFDATGFETPARAAADAHRGDRGRHLAGRRHRR